MKVSNCCGVSGFFGELDAEDCEMCPECKEHCEYIDEEDFTKTFVMENISEQIKNISKASAYDAILPKIQNLEEENSELKEMIRQLMQAGHSVIDGDASYQIFDEACDEAEELLNKRV